MKKKLSKAAKRLTSRRTRKTPRVQPRILVLVATSTQEKTAQYAGIASVIAPQIAFHGLDELLDAFHQITEDKGDRKVHAELKAQSIGEIIAQCKDPDSRLGRLLKKKCEEWGVPYDPDQIFFLADDSTFSVPLEIWKKLHGKLLKYVHRDMLRSANNNGEGGPAAETGPILAATTIIRFFNLLRESALEVGYKEGAPVEITDTTTCVLRRLSDPEGAQQTLLNDAVLTLQLVAPRGLNRLLLGPNVSGAPAERIARTADYLARSDSPTQPISVDFDDHLVYGSQRANIVRQISAIVPSQDQSAETIRRKLPACARVITGRKKRGLFVVQPTSGPSLGNIAHFNVAHRPITDRDSLESALSLNFHRHPRRSETSDLTHADAIILAPVDPRDHKAFLRNFCMFFSAIVAKQTNSKYRSVPIIVMNGNSCYTPMLDLFFDYVNEGMIKAYMMTPLYNGIKPTDSIVKNPKIYHYATNFFDVVDGSDVQQRRAVAEVLDFRLRTYRRREAMAGVQADPKGTLNPHGLFTYGEFTSASSNNETLLRAGAKRGQFLAQNNIALFTGAGDRYAMGAGFHTYVKQARHMDPRKTFCGGVTTPEIVKTETEFGHIPSDYQYAHLVELVGTRIREIYQPSNIIGASPFGAGGVQEIMAGLVGRDLGHPDFIRPIIFNSFNIHPGGQYSGRPYFESFLKHLIGRSACSQMMIDPQIFSSQGMYYAARPQDERRIISQLHTEWKRQPDPTAVRKNIHASSRELFSNRL